MLQITCKCGKVLQITTPIIEIVNQLSFTALVFNHATMAGTQCPDCRECYMPVIKSFRPEAINYQFIPIPKIEEESKIITLH